MATSEGTHHHRSSLKQRNKPFRRGRSVAKSDRGRPAGESSAPVLHRAPRASTKGEKRAQARKSREEARTRIDDERRIFIGPHGVPRVVLLLGLHPLADLGAVNAPGTVPVDDARMRVRFVHAPHGTPHLTLSQMVPAADVVVLVVAVQHNGDGTLAGLDAHSLESLAVLRALGTASDAPIVVQRAGVSRLEPDAPAHIRAEDGRARRALALSWLDALRPHCVPAGRAFTDASDTERPAFLRALCACRVSPVAWRDARPYVLPESVDVLGPTSVAVVGHVRGAPGGLSADSLVSLGGRTLVVRSIDVSTPAGPITYCRSASADTPEALLSPDQCMADCPGELACDSTNDLDCQMQQDSTLDSGSESANQSEAMDDDESMADDQSDESEDEDELRNRKRHFPDAIAVPPGTVLRERLGKYRGVASLRTAAWDAREDLPPLYARLHALADYRHSRRVALDAACEVDAERCAPPGSYVRIVLEGPAPSTADAPLVLLGLLRHEQRAVVQSLSVVPRAPIASRMPCVAVVGLRTMRTRPVLSEHSVGHAAHRLLRCADRPDGAIVATSVLPLTFDPAPALLFDADSGALVATGSVLDADARRIIAKRATLTGVPCRVHKRSVVVRHMFSSPGDIAYFRPVELVARSGARGHIRESVGTHGRMKCVFDRTVMQHDVVAMHLYKRVHPKLHGDEEWAV